MRTKLLFASLFLSIAAIFFLSCEKEPKPVIVSIESEIEGYDVTFSAVVKDADNYEWNFGDGSTSTEKSPKHTYTTSGTYTVSLNVKGPGGEATLTKDIEILPSVEEMLTGGPNETNGKTWVLSRGFTPGVNGGGIIDNNMWVLIPSMPNALDSIGMGSEYDNEYTFYYDGRYKVDVKDTALCSTLYGFYGGEVTLYTFENNLFGLNKSSYTAPEQATWTLHSDNFVIDAITDPTGTAVPAPHAEVTITGKKWVSLSEGAFFGILDFPSTRKFIIKEITPAKMEVALPVCTYWADPIGSGSYPTFFYHMTFVPKE